MNSLGPDEGIEINYPSGQSFIRGVTSLCHRQWDRILNRESLRARELEEIDL